MTKKEKQSENNKPKNKIQKRPKTVEIVKKSSKKSTVKKR